ncbi:MAG: chromate resistance protein [Cellvibrionaceae bacterium]|nr:chromate resistance protein [Cellvibrionaceae bacterium]
MNLRIKHWMLSACIALLTLSGLAYVLVQSIDSQSVDGTDRPDTSRTFVTWDSLEPDKWASIWLINTHIDPQAAIEIRPTGDTLTGGIAFGVPEAQYKRSANQSAFASLLAGFQQTDSVLQQVAEIITAIETTAWNTASDPRVAVVEQHFRRLQDRYSRVSVPVSCYGHFFDVLYQQIHTQANPAHFNTSALSHALAEAVAMPSCEHRSPRSEHKLAERSLVERVGAKRVLEVTIEQLLTEIDSGKNVVFVDTREPAEFAKAHIPGAINIPMRDLNDSVYEQLKQADRVISYCVKDFRGYEVARQLLDNGVEHSAVMLPHGVSGWQASGLPLTSATLSESQAQQQLVDCAKDQRCLK